MTNAPQAGLAWLNRAEEGAAREALHRVCAARAWAEGLLAARPFPGLDALLAANDAATAALTDKDLDEAMAAHPPIGRPEPGDPGSAREQRGMADAPEALRAEMLELGLAYQERFGHVFLICATGLTAGQMRDALRSRLGNAPDAEREIVRAELGRINRLRLTRLAGAATVSTHILDTSRGRPAPGIAVHLAVRPAGDAAWAGHAAAGTDADGRCAALPALPDDAVQARLTFAVAPYLERHGTAPAFFPEVTVAFAVTAGEHYHVPLLLTPFGYSVYRGS
ncbi:2-oxo-4-hydroxy-4-carboxy-5-ureidoimidazoline decarboxylase [Streptomyces sp. 6N223]|uniref:2-oxo-4-hydroxy-4-carboxy-5-ureidoimidazoline decarboxylase n=1 Tax=Streptomyces sp. 6N223 TaxID=3457412 RepID=UPI003FD2A720